VKPNSVTLNKGSDKEVIESVLPFNQNVKNLIELSMIYYEKDLAPIKKRIPK
jgi:hypothetical protein